MELGTKDTQIRAGSAPTQQNPIQEDKDKEEYLGTKATHFLFIYFYLFLFITRVQDEPSP